MNGFKGDNWGDELDFIAMFSTFFIDDIMKCPHCGEEFTLEEVKENFEEDSRSTVCPGCDGEISS